MDQNFMDRSAFYANYNDLKGAGKKAREPDQSAFTSSMRRSSLLPGIRRIHQQSIRVQADEEFRE